MGRRRGRARATLVGAALVVAVLPQATPAAGQTSGLVELTGRVTSFEDLPLERAARNFVVVALTESLESGQVSVELQVEDAESCLRVDLHTDDISFTVGDAPEGFTATADVDVDVVETFSSGTCANPQLPNSSTNRSPMHLVVTTAQGLDTRGVGRIDIGGDTADPLSFEVSSGESLPDTGPDVDPIDALLSGGVSLSGRTLDRLRDRGGCPEEQRCRAVADAGQLAREAMERGRPGAPTEVLDILAAVTGVASLTDDDGDPVSPMLKRLLPVLVKLFAKAADGDETALVAANRVVAFALEAELG